MSAPGLGRLRRVRRAQHDEARDRPERREVLDRLVGRAVLAQRDGVVRPDPRDRQARERREAHGAAHVVGELQERRPVGAHDAAVGGQAVHRAAHAVLAHAEEDVAARVVAGELVLVRELGLRRLAQVRRAADHRRDGLLEGGHDLLARRARRDLVLVPRRRQRRREAGQRLAAPGGVPLGGAVLVGVAPCEVALGPLRVHRGALLDGAERLVHAVGHEEVRVRVPAQGLLREADLVLAQRGAVRLARAHLVRGGPADDRLDPDERRALLLLLGGLDRGPQGVEVVDVVDGLHVPAVGVEARR